MTPRAIRSILPQKCSRSLTAAKMASSTMKGAQRAEAKGQPKIPPTANHQMPQDVLRPPLQFIKAAAPRKDMYMAKLEGK